MKVLALDPGAERMGFAAISQEQGKNKPPEWLGSGFSGLPRKRNEKKIPYQEYRLELIKFWIEEAPRLFDSYTPEVVVSEIVPVVGGGNFVVATQSQLASTAITVLHTIAFQRGLPVIQIAANTIKKRIGGKKDATKVAVRNGVYKIMPYTECYKKEWVRIHDISDAFAVGLTHLGYSHGG